MKNQPAHIKDALPAYGAGSKYLGAEGVDYFQQQRKSGIFAAECNSFLFQHYLSGTDDVLDFGCGGGFLLNVLKAKSKVGVEINPAAREQVKEFGALAFSSLDELEGRKFDKIITSHAIEHIPNPFMVLTKLRAHLKPGGMLIWLSPLDDWRTKYQRVWKERDSDMHLYTWTPLSIGNLLSAAGYAPKSVSVVTHSIPPQPLSRWLWSVNHSVFHAAAYLFAVISKRRQLLVTASPAE